MLSSNRAKAVVNVLLAGFFGVISGGAAMDGRSQAWPLALVSAH
jgi:hypothetical protein